MQASTIGVCVTFAIAIALALIAFGCAFLPNLTDGGRLGLLWLAFVGVIFAALALFGFASEGRCARSAASFVVRDAAVNHPAAWDAVAVE